MAKSLKNKALSCVCGSEKASDECCLAIINGEKSAQNAEQLMRSRYCAYALGRAVYILKSWHISTRPASLDLETSIKWTGLKVLNSCTEKNNTAFVEFVAGFNNAGIAGQMHERSRFVFEEDQWFYVDGEQIESDTQYHFSLPGRNAPCYCGSGKKFKKCCVNKT